MRDEPAFESQTAAPAEPEASAEERAFGHFEVDDNLCIACGLCHDRAPDNIEVPPGSMVAVITRQPETADEDEALTEAGEYCPTAALIRS